jgi:hypothetical protein
LIGHVDKSCEKKLKKGEVQQYSKALRLIPERKRPEVGMGDHATSFRPSWCQGGNGSRGSWGLGNNSLKIGSGSDGPSWRRSDDANEK